MPEIPSSLPFINAATGNLSFWNPVRSGVPQIDGQAGRRHGEALVAEMRAEHNPVLLTGVLRDLAASGNFGPIEIGLIQSIAEELL